jgi:hypothetical protein
MARTKSSKGSQASKSSRSSKSQSSGRSQEQGQNSSSSSEEGFSFSGARDYVQENVSLQTAGLALAGAGILALVSSAAGRSLIRTAATSVARLATENFGEMFGSSDSAEEQETTPASTRQKSSRQRAQNSI